MKPKTIRISYWIVTVIFAVVVALSSIPTEAGEEVMNMLGYPAYLLTILFVAKILGAIALIQPKFQTIKEWAYAGFTIDFTGAAASGMLATESVQLIIMPLIFLAVMFASYFLWKKSAQLKTVEEPMQDFKSSKLKKAGRIPH